MYLHISYMHIFKYIFNCKVQKPLFVNHLLLHRCQKLLCFSEVGTGDTDWMQSYCTSPMVTYRFQFGFTATTTVGFSFFFCWILVGFFLIRKKEERGFNSVKKQNILYKYCFSPLNLWPDKSNIYPFLNIPL